MVKEITIIYDNFTFTSGLRFGYGFSCLIEDENKKLLFDTGRSEEELSFNMNKLGIDPAHIDIVILSHNHPDHCGGIRAVVGNTNNISVYYPEAFSDAYKKDLTRGNAKEYIGIGEDIVKVVDGIFVGPQLNSIFGPSEIPLSIETDKGLAVIIGCAHPGVPRIVRILKRYFDTKGIYLLLGGFHTKIIPVPNITIAKLKMLGVQKVAPCHCTGRRVIPQFLKEFKENFIRIGVGTKITI